MYYWTRGKFDIPLFVRDDHPAALYAGNRRLSPPPVPVWWFPTNWIAIPLVLLLVMMRGAWRWAWK